MHLELTLYLLSSLTQAQSPLGDELPSSLQLSERPAAPRNEMADDPDAQDNKGPTFGYLEVAGNRISIFGILRLDMYWGDGRLNHDQFAFWALSHDKVVNGVTHNRENWIDWTPRMSRLGAKVERDGLPNWADAKLSGVFEFDFQNRAVAETDTNSGTTENEGRELPRLRHAYVKLQAGAFSMLAGQTWDLISPLWPLANFDGMMWNSGNLGDRRPQLRFGWDQPIGPQEQFTSAIAFARTGAIDKQDLDNNGRRDGDESARPMIQIREGLANLMDKHLDLGVWGHYGWERTHAPIGVSGKEVFYTESIGADLRAKFLDVFTFSAEAWYGKNLDDVRGGIGQGVNTVRGREIAARGGWLELAAQVTSWDLLAVGASLDDPRNSSLSPGAITNVYSGTRSRNFARWIYDRIDLGGGFNFGGEIIFWETFYKALDDGRANRYSLFVSWSF